jgi:fibronectin type 3 domain-containing protein
MRNSILIILSTALTIFFNGCSQKDSLFKDISVPRFSVDALDLSKKRLDKSLPRVTGLKARSSISEVILEWKPVRNPLVAGYRIFRIDDKGEYRLIKIINDPYSSHYTDKNLRQRIQNSYLVSLYTKDGRVSVPTKIFIRPSKNNTLKPVTFFKAISGLPNRIKLLWKFSPDPRVDGYVIEKFDPFTNSWKRVARVDKRLSVEYIDKDVKPGVTYKYKIYAVTKDGVYSRASSVVSATPKRLPPPVTGVMATTNLPKKVELIWKPSPQKDIDHYNVYASEFADGLYQLIAQTRATHYIDRFDRDGEVRFYKVTAVDVDGLESTKKIKPIRGRTLGHLKRPTIISARVVNNSVELKWQNNDQRTASYTIIKEYWDGWRVKRQKIVNFKGTVFVDSNIVPDVSYTYYIIAVDKNGIESKRSRAINVKIEGIKKRKSWF